MNHPHSDRHPQPKGGSTNYGILQGLEDEELQFIQLQRLIESQLAIIAKMEALRDEYNAIEERVLLYQKSLNL